MIWRFENGLLDGYYLGVDDRCLVPMALDVGTYDDLCTYELVQKVQPTEFIYRYPGADPADDRHVQPTDDPGSG